MTACALAWISPESASNACWAPAIEVCVSTAWNRELLAGSVPSAPATLAWFGVLATLVKARDCCRFNSTEVGV